jgi:hypothetical protein
MITQLFGSETLKTLIKSSSTVVTLPSGCIFRVGGRFVKTTSALSCNISVTGFGGLDIGSITALTLYFVHAVINGTTEGLVASTSSSLPYGFSSSKIVGAFYTNSSSQVGNTFKSLAPAEVDNIEFTLSTQLSNFGTISDPLAKFSREGRFMKIDFAFTCGTTVASTVEFTIPASLNIDTSYFNASAAQYIVGKFSRYQAVTNNDHALFVDTSIPTKLRFGRTQDAGSAPNAARQGTDWTASDRVCSYNLRVPILEWANPII